MGFGLANHWVWDFWVARGPQRWHLFFLKAPKTLGDPDLRHRNATIGHAVSLDLRSWEVVQDPFEPGPPGAWDDLATWTGCVVRSDREWWMFYTGVSSREDGLIQRVGAATSSDLMKWTKAPENPLSTASPPWYETLDGGWYEQAWRDPWVSRDSAGTYHMFVTARVRNGPIEGRGVLGHLTSSDLVTWRLHPPVTEPGWAGHLEVPQHVLLGGRHYLVYSVTGDRQCDVDPGEGLTGIGYLVSDRISGPYGRGPTRFIYADPIGTLYAGRVVHDDAGPVVLATVNFDAEGRFVGRISNPMPLEVGVDGSLRIGEAG